jgi:hypothetical protein
MADEVRTVDEIKTNQLVAIIEHIERGKLLRITQGDRI